MMNDNNMKSDNTNSTLKEYFGKYLREIRELSESSVKHYFDALNNISKRLRQKGLIQRDIYEIKDLHSLEEMKAVLLADKDFIELDSRGRRMYSAGLNNYIKFASGEDFKNISEKASILDMPIKAEVPMIIEHTTWKRSDILRRQALALADHSCEMDKAHQSFIAEKTKLPYMEGHHAIPLQHQNNFKNSLDVYANIICLCPLCHRKIHYGLKEDRKEMCYRLFESREERLANSGIKINRQEFVDIVIYR